MRTDRPLKVYFVLGEESGDALGADLLPALMNRAQETGRTLEIHGLSGSKLKQLGLNSLFDIEDIAVMGLSAVLARLPKIVRRVYQTVADIVAIKPDVILLIDSPDFTHAVAKRVRRKMPVVPIVNYVCPSVWAWRSGRAKSMKNYVDHVLAILPFEPRVLKELDGPDATYVGHPLAMKVAEFHSRPSTESDDSLETPTLLILPGSRRAEVKKMLALYGETLTVLKEREVAFDAVLPTMDRLRATIDEQIKYWPVRPTLVDSKDNLATFSGARAAIATSGTVALELALHRVPMAMGYKIDPVARLFSKLITTWSSILPNLIADRVLVPEEHNEMVIPGRMARYLERLLLDTPERKLQLDGFDDVIREMQTKRPPSETAANVIFDLLDNKVG